MPNRTVSISLALSVLAFAAGARTGLTQEPSGKKTPPAKTSEPVKAKMIPQTSPEPVKKGDAAEKAPKLPEKKTEAQKKLEEVKKRIVDLSDKHKSVAGEFVMDREIYTGSYRSVSTTLGKFECVRKDGKYSFRQESHTSQTQDLEGQTMLETEQSMTMIGDGKILYTLTEIQGEKAAYKNEQRASHVIADSKAALEKLRGGFDLKVLPDEKLDSEAVYVIEAVPSRGEPGEPRRKTIRYFSKKTGLLVKRVAFDKRERITSTLTVKKIKINPTIKPERFKFEVPKGVPVEDQTKKD
jgi:outer membrane lipoprotein-sorting protein